MSDPKPSRVADYLQHMLQAIERAFAHIADVPDASAFEADAKSQDSVVRTIEIIGEAANKITQADPAFVALHPEIPWQLMRAMRNKIIHDYFEVDYEVVWRTVKNDLPNLAMKVRAALASQNH